MNPTTLAQKILALPCDFGRLSDKERAFYELGHGHMREAAADLAIAHDAERAELVEALNGFQAHLAEYLPSEPRNPHLLGMKEVCDSFAAILAKHQP